MTFKKQNDFEDISFNTPRMMRIIQEHATRYTINHYSKFEGNKYVPLVCIRIF